MADKHDISNSVCFSALLRRLLCSGGSQTHPSDNIFEVEKSKLSRETATQKETEEFQLQARPSPNLVARLMGLETLPEENWVSKSPGPVTRSKSVNFMEFMLKKDEEEEGTLHRRVKTSVSFRELPCTKRNQRNHEFFAMDFDKLDENREIEFKFVKREKGLKKSEQSKKKEAEMKQSEVKRYKRKKVLKLKDEPRKEIKNRNRAMGSKDVSRFVSQSKNGVDFKKSKVIAARRRRNRINPKEKEEEAESGSESSNPSPVSVLELDLEQYLIHDDYSSPGDCATESTRLDSKIKSTEYMTKMIKIPAELSEKDIKETNWFSNSNMFEDLEELCKEIEQEAVDLVLDQLVDELVCNDCTITQNVHI